MEKIQLMENLREDLKYYLRDHTDDETVITSVIGFLLLLEKDIQKLSKKDNS